VSLLKKSLCFQLSTNAIYHCVETVTRKPYGTLLCAFPTCYTSIIACLPVWLRWLQVWSPVDTLPPRPLHWSLPWTLLTGPGQHPVIHIYTGTYCCPSRNVRPTCVGSLADFGERGGEQAELKIVAHQASHKKFKKKLSCWWDISRYDKISDNNHNNHNNHKFNQLTQRVTSGLQ